MGQKLKKTIVCFYISLILHILLFMLFSLTFLLAILGYVTNLESLNAVLFAGVFSGAMIILLLIALKGLNDKQTWAWYFSLIVAGLQFLSLLFFLFSLIAAIGLLNKETTKEFKIKTKKKGKKLIF